MNQWRAKVIHSVRRTEAPEVDGRITNVRYELVSQVKDQNGVIHQEVRPLTPEQAQDRKYIKRLATSVGSAITNSINAIIERNVRRTKSQGSQPDRS